MSTVISRPRVKLRVFQGDVRVTSGGKLLLIGYIAGTLTIASGGYALILGATERLVVEPGGKVTHRGYCRGDVMNEGGELAVMRGSVIGGTLHGREFSRVDPGAIIGQRPQGDPGPKPGDGDGDHSS
jgi:hypothetical protein